MMKKKYQKFLQNALMLGIIIPTILQSQNPTLRGCTDEFACNYGEEVDCEYAITNFDCDGNCIVNVDCTGECAGDLVDDVCGVCGGNGATNGLCPNGMPLLFQFNQSTLQGFYFFDDVTLNGNTIQSEDWVGIFNGDICVGARLWDTSACGGGICDIPAMGNDGGEVTVGYMLTGDIPTFKIFDTSSGTVFDAIPAEEVDGWSNNLFSMNDLLEANGDILGCMEIDACNYDSDATIDNSLCEQFDCEGECGGNAEDLGCGCGQDAPSGCDNSCGSTLDNDECGVCDGDNSTCTGCMENLACNYDEIATIACVNDCCEYAIPDYDCDGNCSIGEDCFGECGGTAILDNCNNCVGGNTGIDIDTCPLDCAGVEGGSAENNDCGTCICNGSEVADGFECSEVDECTQDCTGTYCIEGEEGCLHGTGSDAYGNNGTDDCGVCNGGSVCSGGVNNLGQCNGDFNIGEFNISGFDCLGSCIGSPSYGSSFCYDCAGTPNSDTPAELDDCGICSGGESYFCSLDQGNSESLNNPTAQDDCTEAGGEWIVHTYNIDQDCNDICFGNSVLDECDVCDSDPLNDGLTCESGCMDESATNYYCDMYDCDNLPDDFDYNGICTYNVGGSIEYFNSYLDPAFGTPIVDVDVILFGQPLSLGPVDTINTTTTNPNGEFMFNGVPSNYIEYSLEFKYDEDEANIFTGITSNDASLILDVTVTNTTFDDGYYSDYSAIAADVNMDDLINAYDSYLISNFLNLGVSNMNENNISWRFVLDDEIDTNTSLLGNENIKIFGIKLGDPNGNWE